MLRITDKLDAPVPCSARLTLPFELRQKSRFKARLDDGREVGLVLPRGGLLRGGDCLVADDGTTVLVQAAPEAVSTAYAHGAKLLAEAAYHLGNRHVRLQIGDGWARYLRDHVLDAMVAALGLQVAHECAPFEPLGGAYSAHGHGHTLSHEDHPYVRRN